MLDSSRNIAFASGLSALAGYVDGIGFLHLGGLFVSFMSGNSTRNAMFQIGGGAGLGLTYVTGALVKVGQLIAVALTGGPRFAFLPNLLLWVALVVGGVCGALAYHWINLAAIWFAAGLALALSAFAAVTDQRH
jgi:uncharacterized membrane protein YoaK (UPF0700 family)